MHFPSIGSNSALRRRIGRGMNARARAGVFTPVVIMVLAVFAILGVAYQSSGTSNYGQSAQVIYGLKASMLAAAALEEAQLVIYEKINRVQKTTADLLPWKT